MCFIDRDHCDRNRFRQRQKRICQQPLRRRIEQPDLAVPHGIQRRKIIRLILIAVQADGRDPRITQRRHLILHQRDQRRNNDRQAGHQHRRHLIAYGFSRAGRHDAEDIAAGEDLPDQRFLSLAEIIIAEIFFQDRVRCLLHIAGFLSLHDKIA